VLLLFGLISDLINKYPQVIDNDNGSYSVSFKAAGRGSYRVSVSFNGQDIQGSPFDLRVHCVSAEQSFLEAITPFPIPNQQVNMTIVAADQDGTPLKQGGDQFTLFITVNGQPQVSIASLSQVFS